MIAGALSVWLMSCVEAPNVSDNIEIAPDDIVSGVSFLTPETRTQQEDIFENPGYLWVDRGEILFNTSHNNAKACASCHTDKLVGVAARYPAVDSKTGELFNIERRINTCRDDHQSLPELDYESEDLLALTAYVSNQSIGHKIGVSVTGAAAKHYKAGEQYFRTRRGQFNLSCSQCHNENWGKRLRGDTISQGHLNGFPAYRLEWQGLGSSHRRLRDCDLGVRAEPLDFGDETYISVELYLAARAKGLNVETPAIRR